MSASDIVAHLDRQDLKSDTSITEVILRVNLYEPLRWQAILRRRNCSMGWAVGLGGTADEALAAAYAELMKQNAGREPPGPQVRKRVRK